jgi:hypothetical protein
VAEAVKSAAHNLRPNAAFPTAILQFRGATRGTTHVVAAGSGTPGEEVLSAGRQGLRDQCATTRGAVFCKQIPECPWRRCYFRLSR